MSLLWDASYSRHLLSILKPEWEELLHCYKKSWPHPWIFLPLVSLTTLTCAGADRIPSNRGAQQILADVSVTLPSLQNCELNVIFSAQYLVSIICYIERKYTMTHACPSVLQETNVPTYASWGHVCLAPDTSHQMQTPYQSKVTRIRAGWCFCCCSPCLVSLSHSLLLWKLVSFLFLPPMYLLQLATEQFQ